MFDIAVYTDCTTDEAISGRDGFGFQSLSDGVTAMDERVVEGSLIHVVSSSWPARDDPLEHPETCAYRCHGGRFYLSRGRSTGKTHNLRPGNQLTEVAMTSDPVDFVPYRPAQLFGAANWTLTKAPSKASAQWTTPLRIDPAFEPEELQRMVLSDPWARGVLPVFLTMVEQCATDAHRKLVILHEELAVTMRWIALGTLFLEPDVAMGLSFRAVSANPLAEDAAIVGAAPGFSFRVTTEGDIGVNVFDLEQRATSDVEVSASASMQAQWFIDEDPRAALETIELARRWELHVGATTATVASRWVRLHAGNISSDDWREVLSALNALARAGQEEELEIYGDELVDIIHEREPKNVGDMQLLAATVPALRALGEDDLSCALVALSLEVAAADPTLARAWASSLLKEFDQQGMTEMHWADSDARDNAASHYRTVLSSADVRDLVLMFSLENLLDTGLRADNVQDPVAALVRQWTWEPDLLAAPPKWASDTVEVSLRQHLENELSAGHPEVLAAFGKGNWAWLESTSAPGCTPERPLDGWLTARRAARTDTTSRYALLHDHGQGIPAEAWKMALAGTSPMDESGLWIQWLRNHPEVPASLARYLHQVFAHELQSGRDCTWMVALLEVLADAKTRCPDEWLTDLTRRCASLGTALFEASRTAHASHNPALGSVLYEVPALASLFPHDLVHLVLRCKDRRGVYELAEAGGGWLGQRVARRLADDMAQGRMEALLQALELRQDHSDHLSEAALEALHRVWDDRRCRTTVEDLQRRVPDDWRPLLDSYLEEQSRGRVVRSLFRGGRRLITKNDEVK